MNSAIMFIRKSVIFTPRFVTVSIAAVAKESKVWPTKPKVQQKAPVFFFPNRKFRGTFKLRNWTVTLPGRVISLSDSAG